VVREAETHDVVGLLAAVRWLTGNARTPG
jgi:hypothetical protein